MSSCTLGGVSEPLAHAPAPRPLLQWVKDFAAAGASMYTFHLEAAAAGDDTTAALAALQAAGDAGLPAVHDLIAAIKVRRCWRARLLLFLLLLCRLRLAMARPLAAPRSLQPCAPQAAGMLAGLTIKPGTPVELLLPYVPALDMVRRSAVAPGFVVRQLAAWSPGHPASSEAPSGGSAALHATGSLPPACPPRKPLPRPA